MDCQRCKSKRVLEISAKTSDRLSLQIGDKEYMDYTPESDILTDSDYSPGWEDYLILSFCLDCGQVQGKFPAAKINELED